MRYNEREHACFFIARSRSIHIHVERGFMDENEDLTPEENEIEQTAGVDGDEAHRVGEFDDLRDRLERIESVVNAIAGVLDEMRATADAIDIDNGATVIDADGDGDADIIEDDVAVIPDYDDLDLDL